MIKFLKQNRLQISKFLIVGIVSNIMNFGVYSLIFNLTSKINIAALIGYSVGLLNSFFFSAKWVFKSNSFKFNNTFLVFIVIYFLGGIEMTVSINILHQLIGNYKLAWLIGALIAATNNYLGSKYILFKN